MNNITRSSGNTISWSVCYQCTTDEYLLIDNLDLLFMFIRPNTEVVFKKSEYGPWISTKNFTLSANDSLPVL